MLQNKKMVDTMLPSVILFVCVSVVAGEYCSGSSYLRRSVMHCPKYCCGSRYNRYCCDRNTGLVVGVVFGVIALIAIVVTVLVVVFCCCRKSRGQQGQVCQPAGVTTAVPMYGVQTTTTSYGQVGYANAAFPQQMPISNVAPGTEQKWQELPPAYSTINPN